MCALNIQSSGGMKNSTICATKNQDQQNDERRSFSSGDDKDVFEVRQIDRGRDPRLAIQLAHLEILCTVPMSRPEGKTPPTPEV